MKVHLVVPDANRRRFLMDVLTRDDRGIRCTTGTVEETPEDSDYVIVGPTAQACLTVQQALRQYRARNPDNPVLAFVDTRGFPSMLQAGRAVRAASGTELYDGVLFGTEEQLLDTNRCLTGSVKSIRIASSAWRRISDRVPEAARPPVAASIRFAGKQLTVKELARLSGYSRMGLWKLLDRCRCCAPEKLIMGSRVLVAAELVCALSVTPGKATSVMGFDESKSLAMLLARHSSLSLAQLRDPDVLAQIRSEYLQLVLGP